MCRISTPYFGRQATLTLRKNLLLSLQASLNILLGISLLRGGIPGSCLVEIAVICFQAISGYPDSLTTTASRLEIED